MLESSTFPFLLKPLLKWLIRDRRNVYCLTTFAFWNGTSCYIKCPTGRLITYRFEVDSRSFDKHYEHSVTIETKETVRTWCKYLLGIFSTLTLAYLHALYDTSSWVFWWFASQRSLSKSENVLVFFRTSCKGRYNFFFQEWVALRYAPESVKTTKLPTNLRPVLKSSS